MNYTVENLPLEGLKLIIPKIYQDNRGLFFENYNHHAINEIIGDIAFVQDNVSYSGENVVRGLHYQLPPYGQGKLVSVLRGEVLDVAVDIRSNSPTFGKHQIVKLSENNHHLFWIPEGFAHGFAVLSRECIFNYKCTQYYSKTSERGINWADPKMGIDWGISALNAIISDKDAVLPSWNEVVDFFKGKFKICILTG